MSDNGLVQSQRVRHLYIIMEDFLPSSSSESKKHKLLKWTDWNAEMWKIYAVKIQHFETWADPQRSSFLALILKNSKGPKYLHMSIPMLLKNENKFALNQSQSSFFSRKKWPLLVSLHFKMTDFHSKNAVFLTLEFQINQEMKQQLRFKCQILKKDQKKPIFTSWSNSKETLEL